MSERSLILRDLQHSRAPNPLGFEIIVAISIQPRARSRAAPAPAHAPGPFDTRDSKTAVTATDGYAQTSRSIRDGHRSHRKKFLSDYPRAAGGSSRWFCFLRL